MTPTEFIQLCDWTRGQVDELIGQLTQVVELHRAAAGRATAEQQADWLRTITRASHSADRFRQLRQQGEMLLPQVPPELRVKGRAMLQDLDRAISAVAECQCVLHSQAGEG